MLLCFLLLAVTVYREIFAVKKFSRLSVTAKISRTNFFSTTKYRNRVPDPRGSFSSSIPAIAAANREAVRTASSGKRRPYGQYSLDCSVRNWQVRLRSSSLLAHSLPYCGQEGKRSAFCICISHSTFRVLRFAPRISMGGAYVSWVFMSGLTCVTDGHGITGTT